VTVALDAVELVRVRLALRRPMESAHGTETHREVVLVRAIGAGGLEGWGECSALEAPTYSGEYTDGAWAVLRDHIVPAVLGRSIGGVRGHPFAMSALATAIADLEWQSGGAAYAIGNARSVEGSWWTAVLGIPSDLAELLGAVEAALTAGATGLKLKVRPGDDLASIDAVAKVTTSVPIAVDANGGYEDDLERLIEVTDLLAANRPVSGDDESLRSYVEQPLAADDLLGHVAIAPRLAVPIALDESIGTARDVELAWALGATQLVNVKPARHNDRDLDRLATVTRAFESGDGPELFLGGMLETGVGRSAALAQAGPLGIRVTDLGPSHWYFEDDITDPIDLDDDGRIRWPKTAGLTLAPRPDRLAEATVERLLIRP
jgi:o-succinylbenzoate synthase